MELDRATIAARLTDWVAFYSEEIWLRHLAAMPLTDALDVILEGRPAWVTKGSPEVACGTAFNRAGWAVDELLTAAWCSGDTELTALADHCEDLATAYLMH